MEEVDKKFRTTVHQAPVAICILRGSDFIIEMANDKMLELWNKTLDQVINKKIFDGVPESAGQGFEQILKNVYTKGEQFFANEVPITLSRKNGTQKVYVNYIYEPLREEDGTISGITAVAADVTQQVQAKYAIQENEKQFRNLIMPSPIAMAIFKGKDMVVELANHAMLKLWQRDGQYVIGRKHLELLPELIDQKYPALMDQVFTTGIPYQENESLAIIHHGTEKIEFYLNYLYAPLFESDGTTVSGLMVTVNDVTEMVLARQQLKDAADRIKLATEGTQLATWDLNLQTRHIIYSPRLAVIFGHPESKIITHQQMRDQIHREDIHLIVEAAFDKALQTGIYAYEARVIHPDKTVHWIKTQGKVIFDKQHVPQRVLGTMQDITDEKIAEEKISRLAAIIHSSNDAILSKTLDGIITSWNDSAQRMFGYSPDEIIGRHISTLIPPHLADEELTIIAQLKRGEQLEHFETQRLTKDKRLLDISLTVSPIKDSRGNIIGASKVVRDITEQKQAERTISESEERLKIVVDASELGMWELNLVTKEFIYSERYSQILGYGGRTDISHSEFLKHLHPDDLPIREKAFHDAFKTGMLHYVSRLIWNDGTLHWIEAKGKVFYDKLNNPFKLIGTARDLTEEKSYQQELQDSEKKFRLLADSMPQFIWTGDAAGTLNYFNQSVYDYSGLTHKQIVKDGWLQIVHPDDQQENVKRWTEAIATGDDFIFEHRFRRRDGEYRWQLSRAIPQRNADGHVQMWVGTSTDIHDQKLMTDELERRVALRTQELKQVNDELARSNTELASFSYVASHDLQEPLRKIQTFATRLLENEKNNLSETGQDYFKRMQYAALRMQTLINDLLTYSRINTNEKLLQRTDLNTILRDVKNDLKETIEEKNATFESSNLPSLMVIPFQFGQLLTNLIGNSLKFSKTDSAPHITLSTEEVKGKDIKDYQAPSEVSYYKFTLADNGIGFDQKYGDLIFQVFQRLHGRNEYTGTGIGLSICKKIIENHHGFISASSVPNHGATFTFYIPS